MQRLRKLLSSSLNVRQDRKEYMDIVQTVPSEAAGLPPLVDCRDLSRVRPVLPWSPHYMTGSRRCVQKLSHQFGFVRVPGRPSVDFEQQWRMLDFTYMDLLQGGAPLMQSGVRPNVFALPIRRPCCRDIFHAHHVLVIKLDHRTLGPWKLPQVLEMCLDCPSYREIDLEYMSTFMDPAFHRRRAKRTNA